MSGRKKLKNGVGVFFDLGGKSQFPEGEGRLPPEPGGDINPLGRKKVTS
jgi:hypothetical protein